MKYFTNKDGFTLIELLVVILIIGILIAVSAPSFLGQTQKAHDSAIKQQLAVAYRAEKAASVDNVPQGSWSAPAQAVTDIVNSEPELNGKIGTVASSASVLDGNLGVDTASNATTLTIYGRASNGDLFTLTATANGVMTIAP